jgi:hypothetical protein
MRKQDALTVVRNCGISLILYLIQMFKTLFSFSLLFICACTNRTDRNKPQQNIFVQWQYLTLELNDTVIQLAQTADTLEVVTVKGGAQKCHINKTEKDSIFAQANELIDFKGQPKRFCTDYFGKLKVQIRYNSQLMKEVSFTSICDWRKLNVNTNQIDQLLKKVGDTK